MVEETKKYDDMSREEKIKFHREQAKELKNENRFLGFYKEVRNETYQVSKMKGTDEEKKEKMKEVLSQLLDKMEKQE